MNLFARREQIFRGQSSLDEMIRHHSMHDVFGSPLRHMAIDAAFGDRACLGRRMTIAADLLILLAGLMRIVTRGAGHLTLLETLRLREAVSGMIDFERVGVDEIEQHLVIRQRFARPIAKGPAVVTTD